MWSGIGLRGSHGRRKNGLRDGRERGGREYSCPPTLDELPPPKDRAPMAKGRQAVLAH